MDAERAMAMSGSKRRVLLGIILILALWLRATGIEWSLPDEHHYRTYCSDEHRAVCMALMMEPSEGQLTPIWRGKPYFRWGSFHIYTLTGTYAIAASLGWIETGGALGSWSVETFARATLLARWLSVLYGVASVALIYLLGKRWYGARVGLGAALLYAIMPLDVFNAHFALINAVASFWMLLALYMIGRALERARLRDHATAGLVIGIAIGTKLSAVPLLPVALVIAAWSAWLHRSDGALAKRTASACLCVLLCAFLGFAIATPYAFVHPQQFLNHAHIELVLHPAKGHGLMFQETGNGFIYLLFTNLPVALGWPLWCLALGAFLWLSNRFANDLRAGVWRAPTPRFIGDTLVLVWTVGLVIAMSRSQVRFIRYLMAITPCIALFGSALITELINKKGQRWRTISLRGAALLIVSATGFYALSHSLALTGSDPRDEARAWFEEHVPRGAKIGLLNWPTHHIPPVSPWAKSASKGPSAKAQKKGIGPKRLRWTLLDKQPEKLLAERPDWLVLNPIDLVDGLRLGDQDLMSLAELIERDYVDAAGPWTSTTTLLGVPCDWGAELRGWAPTTTTVRILKRR